MLLVLVLVHLVLLLLPLLLLLLLRPMAVMQHRWVATVRVRSVSLVLARTLTL